MGVETGEGRADMARYYEDEVDLIVGRSRCAANKTALSP